MRSYTMTEIFQYLFWNAMFLHCGQCASTLTDVYTTEGASAVFLLPAYTNCGQYYFTDWKHDRILTVIGDVDTSISHMYIERSTVRYHDNHTMIFTLHRTTWQDVGVYRVDPVDAAIPLDCRRVYTLTLQTDIVREADWLNWGAWSTCDVSCGPGTMLRTRDCSQPVGCHHGDRQQVTECRRTEPCFQRTPEYIGANSESTKDRASERGYYMPMSVMIGGGAGVVILVLLVVITALICRLRRRRRQAVRITTVYSPRQQTLNIPDINRKPSEISEVSGTHVYEDIDERLSEVGSHCNDYLPLPPASQGEPLYHNTARNPGLLEPLYRNVTVDTRQ